MSNKITNIEKVIGLCRPMMKKTVDLIMDGMERIIVPAYGHRPDREIAEALVVVRTAMTVSIENNYRDLADEVSEEALDKYVKFLSDIDVQEMQMKISSMDTQKLLNKANHHLVRAIKDTDNQILQDLKLSITNQIKE